VKIISYTAEDSMQSIGENLSCAFDNSYAGCALALGFFDGVHVAHRRLIEKARTEASRFGLPLVIFTFSGKSASLKAGAERLYTDEEKLSLLGECGADAVIITDFSAVSEIDKESFVSDFIIKALNAAVAVVGYDFKFGKGAAGSSSDLKRYMNEFGRECVLFEMLTDSDSPISSTRIRELLRKRDMTEAARLLGKPYFITGKVQHGLGLGKNLGIPTVNTDLPSGRFSLPNGVYLSALSLGKKNYLALTNIGVCPTFGERTSHAETYILGFDGDLYGESLRIYLCAYLRDEKKFESEKELKEQIKSDTDKALALWEDIKWQEIGLN
jgi:riboflavin kinase/FMN adenylyltransferase